MLLKLNEGEGLTVQANHVEGSNSYCINNFSGKTVCCREFPGGNPPNSKEQGNPKNSAEKAQPSGNQHLKAESLPDCTKDTHPACFSSGIECHVCRRNTRNVDDKDYFIGKPSAD